VPRGCHKPEFGRCTRVSATLPTDWGRNEHLDSLTKQLTSEVPHLIVLREGMRKKELDAIQARLAAIPGGGGGL
jgi:hypothetical protein